MSASPQPGGRDAAPGRLGLLQAFINTHFDLVGEWGADLLATPAGLRRWLADHGLLARRTRVTTTDLERAIVVREGLRTLLAARGDGVGGSSLRAGLNEAFTGASLEVRMTPRGVELVPVGSSGVDRAIGSLLATLAEAIVDGSWQRLKVCPGRHCGWAFYDHSRNNSGRWCSMNVCGGREKARAHYHRQRSH
ncbi:MAG TPA: CGNR zinc finger domain-containing protein [Gaiellales bacterium]|nr:CGNR zinc finger domain-containing protein [Gaiellales bacterium]